jgi:hypothetical protein
MRVQEEIIRTSSDQNTFACRLSQRYAVQELFAPSPAAFTESQNFVPVPSRGPTRIFTITNRGLRIQLAFTERLPNGEQIAALDCMDQRTGIRLGLSLIHIGQDRYVRTRLDQLHQLGRSRPPRTPLILQRKTVYVPQNV